jgi:predicted RNA binding protein YcfA (HicA-like mRNA interferase family)
MSNAAKEARELAAEAARQGWRVEDKGSHFKMFSPDGVTIVTLAKTPSDRRWRENTISKLRKGGFQR